VSNAIRYDSLLVRELARELHNVLAGARLEGLFLDRERLRLTLRTKPASRGAGAAPSLLWQLHPESGHLTAAPPGDAAGRVQLRALTRIRSVRAPRDERIVIIDLEPGAGAAGTPQRIVIELITNQWNALAVAADGRIVAALRERIIRGRELRTGAAWTLPRPSGRRGVAERLSLEEWTAGLRDVPPGERLAALPRFAAWASPQNAAWIIGDADVTPGDAVLERAWRRYTALLTSDRLTAVLLHDDGRWQPYVAAGDHEDAVPTLLHAFAEAAGRTAAAPTLSDSTEQALAAVAERIDAVEKRTQRLESERAGAAEEAARLRGNADVLMSQLHVLQRGMASAELPDFAGGTVTLELDPALTGPDNAAKLYDAARRRDRAAARIPDLLLKARRERDRLEQLAGRIREGTASTEELERLQRTRVVAGRDAPAPLPYRVYRTGSGLEVRVGRGSRSNDDLTFRHSAPNDIWLHARDVAGAHVILRWTRADANPPAADIAEAANLAALSSKARTSGTVPVDWTRRKHVRKPRKAGPGLVIPERVKTVFVEPDPSAADRMRSDEQG
jgi:predicted ribosome quality control (RQC) complex YloA/Tae2 family protein